jgi:hypothetical protein
MKTFRKLLTLMTIVGSTYVMSSCNGRSSPEPRYIEPQPVVEPVEPVKIDTINEYDYKTKETVIGKIKLIFYEKDSISKTTDNSYFKNFGTVERSLNVIKHWPDTTISISQGTKEVTITDNWASIADLREKGITGKLSGCTEYLNGNSDTTGAYYGEGGRYREYPDSTLPHNAQAMLNAQGFYDFVLPHLQSNNWEGVDSTMLENKVNALFVYAQPVKHSVPKGNQKQTSKVPYKKGGETKKNDGSSISF